jgi:hypothetical protein
MANVHLLSVRILDDDGTVGHVNLFLPATLSLSDVQTFVNTFLPHLDTITGGKIDGVSVSLALTLPGGLKASAIADHPIQWGVNWSWDVANTPYRYTMHIPAVDQGILVGDEVDVGIGYVGAFIVDMIDGVTGNQPCDRFGNDISGYLATAVSFRKA